MNTRHIVLGSAVAGIVLGALALGNTWSANAADPLAALKVKYVRPNAVPYPADNPPSDAKIALGHTLFFDPRLSGPETMSCATCHNPARGWGDGLPKGVGSNAKQLGRKTPTILDLAWAELLFWDGRADSLEDQATGPIQAPAEMNKVMANLITELSQVPGYRGMFKAAFGSEEITKRQREARLSSLQRQGQLRGLPFRLALLRRRVPRHRPEEPGSRPRRAGAGRADAGARLQDADLAQHRAPGAVHARRLRQDAA
jgi:cytochrome c peroxidase